MKTSPFLLTLTFVVFANISNFDNNFARSEILHSSRRFNFESSPSRSVEHREIGESRQGFPEERSIRRVVREADNRRSSVRDESRRHVIDKPRILDNQDQRRLVKENRERESARRTVRQSSERREENRRLVRENREREDSQRRTVREDNNRRLIREDNDRRVVREDNNRRLVREDNNRRLVRDNNNRQLVREDNDRRHLVRNDNRRRTASDDKAQRAVRENRETENSRRIVRENREREVNRRVIQENRNEDRRLVRDVPDRTVRESSPRVDRESARRTVREARDSGSDRVARDTVRLAEAGRVDEEKTRLIRVKRADVRREVHENLERKAEERRFVIAGDKEYRDESRAVVRDMSPARGGEMKRFVRESLATSSGTVRELSDKTFPIVGGKDHGTFGWNQFSSVIFGGAALLLLYAQNHQPKKLGMD